jgi:hypothetical protein
MLTRLAAMLLQWRKMSHRTHTELKHAGNWEVCELEPCKERAYIFHYAGSGEPPANALDAIRRTA